MSEAIQRVVFDCNIFAQAIITPLCRKVLFFLNALNSERHDVTAQKHARNAGGRKFEIVGNLVRDDCASTRTIAKMLVNPAHVIKELTERSVSPHGKLKLNHEIFAVAIYGE